VQVVIALVEAGSEAREGGELAALWVDDRGSTEDDARKAGTYLRVAHPMVRVDTRVVNEGELMNDITRVAG
jgi:hypothetical protein